MKITICGSMATQELLAGIQDAACKLRAMGHEVFVPDEGEATSDYSNLSATEAAARKGFYMKDYFAKIEACDTVIIMNPLKKGIEGYIGSNTVIEMGLAFYLGKRICILNSVTKQVPCYDEVIGMQPEVLHGNLDIFEQQLV